MQKVLVTILLATACLSTSLPAVATEQVRRAEESQSFFERYTNAAQDVILQGLKLVGVRYRLGGNDEDSGLDCSGFVRLVYKDSVGALLPRTAAEMSQMGQRIDTSQLKPGDLVFFNTRNKPFSHVGIYIGEDRFVHAPRTNSYIQVSSLKSGYFSSRFESARRYLN